MQLINVMFCTASFAQEVGVKVEPPNWWVNMPNPKLQLMCHGKHLSSFDVSTDAAFAKIDRVHRADSPHYLFIDLDLRAVKSAGELALHFTSADTSFTLNYPLKAREEGGWVPNGMDGSDAIYLITPDRFANGDPTNDEVAGMLEGIDRSDLFGRHGGDIAGIIDHIDYLDSMGFTSIWSSPVMVNDQPEASYHGYAVTDLYQIDPRMGSLEDYKALSQSLHERGMKLIMDYIPNHIGDRHWWMQDLPFEDWINYGGVFHPTHHNRNTLHDPHASEEDRRGFTDGWFVETMPDLNQRNPFLAQYLLQNSIWWIETAELDGLRIDTYPYSDRAFLNAWSCDLQDLYPTLGMVGEEWTDQANYIAYWQQGNQRNPATCLPSLFDFPLQTAIVSAITQDEGWGTGWVKLHEALARDYHYPDPNNLVIFLDNHDMDRFYRQVGGDLDRYKMGLSILLTMRGIPQIYYGTELLTANEQGGNHGDIRSHFPGTWPDDSIDGRLARSLSEDQRQAQAHLQQLLQFRKGSSAIQTGSLQQFLPQDEVYCFVRSSAEEVVIVASNKSSQEQVIDPRDYLNTELRSIELVDALSARVHMPEQSISIPARSSLILVGKTPMK